MSNDLTAKMRQALLDAQGASLYYTVAGYARLGKIGVYHNAQSIKALLRRGYLAAREDRSRVLDITTAGRKALQS